MNYFTDAMGAELTAEVELQLIEDLKQYGVCQTGLSIDWSDPCPEGHCTEVMGSELESASDIQVLDALGKTVADGWIDFVHGEGIHVFWHYLTIVSDEGAVEVKPHPEIPVHVWQSLSEASRAICVRDERWSKDSNVIAWKRKHCQ